MSDSTKSEVRCCECGFLSVRDKESGELRETDDTLRMTWKIPIVTIGVERIYRVPICYVGAVDFAVELGEEKHDRSVPMREILPVVQKQRECPKFTAWKRGRSPKWHQDMIEMTELHQLQDTQREKERAWQEAQKDRDVKREDALKAREEKREDDREQRERAFQKEQREADNAFKDLLDRRSRRWAFATAILIAGLTAFFTWLIQSTKEAAAPVPPIIIQMPDGKPK